MNNLLDFWQGRACDWSRLRHGTRYGASFRRAGAAVVLADFREDAVQIEASKLAAEGHKAPAIRTAALEYIKQDIYVNAVNPGLIDTQIARDVVSGKNRLMPISRSKSRSAERAGQRRLPRSFFGFAALEQATSWARPSPQTEA